MKNSLDQQNARQVLQNPSLFFKYCSMPQVRTWHDQVAGERVGGWKVIGLVPIGIFMNNDGSLLSLCG